MVQGLGHIGAEEFKPFVFFQKVEVCGCQFSGVCWSIAVGTDLPTCSSGVESFAQSSA